MPACRRSGPSPGAPVLLPRLLVSRPARLAPHRPDRAAADPSRRADPGRGRRHPHAPPWPQDPRGGLAPRPTRGRTAADRVGPLLGRGRHPRGSAVRAAPRDVPAGPGPPVAAQDPASKPALARELVDLLADRFGDRRLHLVGDAGYATRAFAGLDPRRVTVTVRPRGDAALYELPPPRTGRPGRPRVKGARLGSIAE